MLEVKWLMHILAYLPFFSIGSTNEDQTPVSKLISRLLEAAIIGGVIMYANVQVLNAKLNGASNTMLRMAEQLKQQDVLIRGLREDVIVLREQLRHYRNSVNSAKNE